MIKAKKTSRKIEIDLTGEAGNAFALLGSAANLSKQLRLDTKSILNEMMSSDYEHLVQTFDKYFGDYVILYR
jgi:hypothetical protein